MKMILINFSQKTIYFLYSYHSMSNFNMGLKETENIRFIDNNENHLFDNIEHDRN